MKFNLYLLADRMASYSLDISANATTKLNLDKIEIPEKNTAIKSNIAYLISGNKEHWMRKQDSKEQFSFIVLNMDDQFDLPANWNILSIHTTKSVQNVYRDLLESIYQLASWSEELALSIVSQQPLQQQLDIAVRFLKNPVALFDMSYSAIAWAGNMPETITDPTWQRVLNQGYNTIESFRPSVRRQMEHSVGSREVVIVPGLNQPSDNRSMMVTLYNNNLPYVNMAMNELCAKIDEAEYSYLTIIKTWMERSPVLLRQIVLAENKGTKLLLRLLNGTPVSTQELQMFLRENNWRSTDHYQVYYFKHKGDNAINESSFRSFSNLFHSSVPGLLIFLINNHIIGIDRDPEHSDIRQRLPEALLRGNLLCGASMIYSDYQNLHLANMQAQDALNHRPDHQSLAFYKDIYMTNTLRTLGSKGDLMHYLHPLLLQFDLNDDWHRDLVITLYHYLISGGKIAPIADKLSIHRNTVLYRLTVINGIMDCEVESLSEEETNMLRLSTILLCAEKIF